jgi:uncharacterized protein (DUF927 family)
MKGRIPSLEEFREMRNRYGNGRELFGDIMDDYDLRERDDFYDWWNNYHGEDEERDFLKRYTKLGKLLAGVDDV